MVETTTAWYFFNTSWSPTDSDRNVTINVSHTIPLAGNISLIAGFSNVTGQTTDFLRNITTTLDSTTGLSGGYLYNDTSSLTFNSLSAVVPVNVSFGENTYAGSFQQKGLGSVVILNFNPVNSLPSKNFNITHTTNWTTIPDLTAVHNLTFVIEEPTTHTLLGNISFNQDLDLTNPDIVNGLQVLGNYLTMGAAGNSINLTIANSALQVFNKPATLTVFPTGFSFSSGRDIKITATTDAGASTVLYDNGAWITRGDFVDANSDVSIGSGNITLPVLHFSKFDFDPSSGTGGGGGGGTAGAAYGVVYPISNMTTASVNVGGNSAINSVEVTGVGVANIIVTATTHPALPSSISPPDAAMYQYIEVTPSQYTEISNAVITFTVQKSWLEENGCTENDVAILRYSNGIWTPLSSVIIGYNNAFFTYQATTGEFSYFAIVCSKGAAMLAPVNVTETQNPASTIPVNVIETQTPVSSIPVNVTPAEGATVIPTTKKTPGFDTLVATAAVTATLGGAWVASRKKRLY